MNEVFIVGALLLILMAAAAFFLYSRLLYAERKIGLIESILLDIKMSMEMEEDARPVMPAKEAPVFAPMVDETSPSAAEALTTEADVAYYSSVIESAVEAPTVEDAEVAEPAPQEQIPAAQLNYDAYTRDELAAIAEKRGLRVTKRMSKGAIADLLRGSEQTSSAVSVAGDEQPMGAAITTGGAPLDNGPLEEVELSV
jgi:hypothetical protein